MLETLHTSLFVFYLIFYYLSIHLILIFVKCLFSHYTLQLFTFYSIEIERSLERLGIFLTLLPIKFSDIRTLRIDMQFSLNYTLVFRDCDLTYPSILFRASLLTKKKLLQDPLMYRVCDVNRVYRISAIHHALRRAMSRSHRPVFDPSFNACVVAWPACSH